MKISRFACVKAVAAVGLAVAALGTASVAQARSDVYFSIGADIAPGVTLGVSNAPYYRPATVYSYYQPPTVYYTSPPPVVYYPGPVVYQPSYFAPVVTYVRPRHHHRHHWHHWHHQPHYYRY